MIYKFYDTCSLLLKANNLWDEDNVITLISSITLNELEEIKTSRDKDPELKFSACRVIKELDNHLNDTNTLRIIMWKEDTMMKTLHKLSLPINNDAKIITCAYEALKSYNDTFYFYTNDISCKILAMQVLNCKVYTYEEETFSYDGFKEVQMSQGEMIDFYSNLNMNNCNLFINQYLLIKDETGEIVDCLCWTGETHRKVARETFKSDFFGNVKPLKDDWYQVMACDSLMNNKISMIKGYPGSGKSFLSLAFLMYKLEKHQIDKIVVFCNPVATKNSAKLGFYPGTRDEKLLDSQIGNLLSSNSKFGSKLVLSQMMEKEKLILLPVSDIRGYDTSGMRAGIYISEAQNLDTELMKLVLQRIGEDCICVIDGDNNTQVDDVHFFGNANGMKRVSQVFRGHDIYGEVCLKKIHRSKIAEIAENI